jgi:hypothetical protein
MLECFLTVALSNEPVTYVVPAETVDELENNIKEKMQQFQRLFYVGDFFTSYWSGEVPCFRKGSGGIQLTIVH